MDKVGKMVEYVAECDDPNKLRQVIVNAENQGAADLVRAAKLKLYSVLPCEEPGTLGHDVWRSIYALEDALKQERGKTVLLSRTRQKIARQGEAQCVADLVLGPPSEGFKMLHDRDMLDVSFEQIALDHPILFAKRVLDAAKLRLDQAEKAGE